MAKRIIIAGGGTGRTYFSGNSYCKWPLKKLHPKQKFYLSVQKEKMEMEKVPQAGYKIEGLDIAGFNRSSLIKNIGLPLKLIKSFAQVRKIFSSIQSGCSDRSGRLFYFSGIALCPKQGHCFFHTRKQFLCWKSKYLIRKKSQQNFCSSTREWKNSF